MVFISFCRVVLLLVLLGDKGSEVFLCFIGGSGWGVVDGWCGGGWK